ncbi:MAG TPA: protein translocase subunit SecF [Polyangiaceae bacterium]|nr:protein translocase subunit SecF [Polyangiaceae bacterium]
MRFFSGGKIYDFMRWRFFFVGLSLIMTFGSIALLAMGRARLGTDFRGGTEIEVAFKGHVTVAEIRRAVEAGGFSSPDVIKVDDLRNADRYLVRVQEVSTIAREVQEQVERKLCFGNNLDATACPPSKQATEVRFSPGGDKITARYNQDPDLEWVKEQAASVAGIHLHPGANNPHIQNARDHKVEIELMSKGDQLISALQKGLGARAPDQALRSEWIGPRAGAQLRDSAIKSILIEIVFIMAYIAFRFDLRFAPGGIIALFHDATGSIGMLILLGKEIDLTTVAAILTIIGYSVNDTVVIYDRVRENLGKLRGASFRELINISTSEMLGRTILTTATVEMSMLAFFIWGTGTLKNFAFSLTVGLIFGTYSTIYIALPVTEWLDKVLFSRMSGGTGGPSGGSRGSRGRPKAKRAVAPA